MFYVIHKETRDLIHQLLATGVFPQANGGAVVRAMLALDSAEERNTLYKAVPPARVVRPDPDEQVAPPPSSLPEAPPEDPSPPVGAAFSEERDEASVV